MARHDLSRHADPLDLAGRVKALEEAEQVIPGNGKQVPDAQLRQPRRQIVPDGACHRFLLLAGVAASVPAAVSNLVAQGFPPSRASVCHARYGETSP